MLKIDAKDEGGVVEECWNYDSTKNLACSEGENVHTRANFSNQSTSELIQQHKITKKEYLS